MGTPGLPFTLAARCPRDSRTLPRRPYAAAQSSAATRRWGKVCSRPRPAGPAPLARVQTVPGKTCPYAWTCSHATRGHGGRGASAAWDRVSRHLATKALTAF